MNLETFLPFLRTGKLLKLSPHKFFHATGRTIKYALVAYGVLHFLAAGLSLAGPDSLFSNHFYKPVILANLGQLGLAFPTLLTLWLLNKLVATLWQNFKFVLQLLATLAVLAVVAFVFWWLFVRSVGG